MRAFLLLLLYGCWTILLTGQNAPISTDPAFPTVDAEINIIFDATKGNAGLEDCNCDVYLHTGLITDNSSSNTDWQYVQGEWGQDIPRLKMTKTGDNKYEFKLTIRDFYSVPESENVKSMAFVIRNVDGSQAGRAPDGSDIIVDVFANAEGIVARLTEPDPEGFTILNPGESIRIQGEASSSAFLKLEESGNLLFETTEAATTIDFNYTPDQNPGYYTVQFIATNATNALDADTTSFNYLLLGESNAVDVPAGLKLGLNRQEDGSASFLIHAPGKDNIILLGDFNDWTPSPDFVLNKSTDGNDFWIKVEGLETGTWYRYQYLVDGTLRVADPYSELVLDPGNDSFIPTTVNDQIPPYPTNLSNAGIVTVFKMEGFPYDWEVDDFQKPKTEDLFIYELLVRDFLDSHSYKDLIDTLDYLEKLGVNAIEFMPINEFEGNLSWGYNPSFHMALDKYYGDPITFKRFVDEAHKRGMAVLLDVVYNHAFSQSPLAQLYWDAGNFRPAPDNPWLNVTPTHPFNVGYDFNHESQATKDFVTRVTQYWIEEFRVDGYRFDLTKGFTQKFSGDDNNIASQYDQSRIDILTDIGDNIKVVDPNSILILEHFANNDEEKELSDRGFLLWGNLNFNYNEATMGYHDNNKSDFSWGYFVNRGWTNPNLITFMESHDEERLMYKNTQFGNSNGAYSVKDLNTGLDRVRLANTFFWTIPGPKMIWQFGELGYDFSINYCPNGTIAEGCRVDNKPIRWDYNENSKRKAIYYHISDLAHLKEQFSEAFATDQVNLSLNPSVKQITLEHEDLDVVAIGNFDVVEKNQSFSFPQNGTWYNYLNGDSIVVNNNSQNFTLDPGEHQLWITKFVERPNFEQVVVSNKDQFASTASFQLFPNPTHSGSQTVIQSEGFSNEHLQVQLMDITGKQLFYQNLSINRGFDQQLLPTDHLQKGMYLVRLVDPKTGQQWTKKLIVE